MAEWLKERKIESVAMESTGSLLDRATRNIGAARIGSGAGEHTRTGPSTGAEEERPGGLPMEPAAAQLRTADRLVPTERAGVPVADIGAR